MLFDTVLSDESLSPELFFTVIDYFLSDMVLFPDYESKIIRYIDGLNVTQKNLSTTMYFLINETNSDNNDIIVKKIFEGLKYINDIELNDGFNLWDLAHFWKYSFISIIEKLMKKDLLTNKQVERIAIEIQLFIDKASINNESKMNWISSYKNFIFEYKLSLNTNYDSKRSYFNKIFSKETTEKEFSKSTKDLMLSNLKKHDKLKLLILGYNNHKIRYNTRDAAEDVMEIIATMGTFSEDNKSSVEQFIRTAVSKEFKSKLYENFPQKFFRDLSSYQMNNPFISDVYPFILKKILKYMNNDNKNADFILEFFLDSVAISSTQPLSNTEIIYYISNNFKMDNSLLLKFLDRILITEHKPEDQEKMVKLLSIKLDHVLDAYDLSRDWVKRTVFEIHHKFLTIVYTYDLPP